jgi:hypothetical protein
MTSIRGSSTTRQPGRIVDSSLIVSVAWHGRGQIGAELRAWRAKSAFDRVSTAEAILHVLSQAIALSKQQL